LVWPLRYRSRRCSRLLAGAGRGPRSRRHPPAAPLGARLLL